MPDTKLALVEDDTSPAPYREPAPIVMAPRKKRSWWWRRGHRKVVALIERRNAVMVEQRRILAELDVMHGHVEVAGKRYTPQVGGNGKWMFDFMNIDHFTFPIDDTLDDEAADTAETFKRRASAELLFMTFKQLVRVRGDCHRKLAKLIRNRPDLFEEE